MKEGYLQTKISELDEKVKEFEKKNDLLSFEMNNIKKDVESKSKDITNSISELKELKDNFKDEEIEQKIKDLAIKNTEEIIKKVTKQLDKILNEKQSEITNKNNIDIKDLNNTLGSQIISDVEYLFESLGNVLFDMNKILIEKGIFSKDTFDPNVIMCENKYGGKDKIIVFNFEKNCLTKDEGIGLVKKWMKKHKIILNKKANDGSNTSENILRNPVKKLSLN